MQAPIALFVYNRIEHTKQVLQALEKNIDADKSELYIFSDAPSDETEKENVAKVRKYVDAYSHTDKFKHVEVCYAQKNKGLSTSLIDGITKIINQYGRIIVLEDDHLTSPDFIVFMNRALDYYENDSKIWSISGFTPDFHALHYYKHDVYCGCRGYCWGWATWKNRFDKVDWEVKDYDNFVKDKQAQRGFNRGGLDMTPLLKLQQEGKVNSWAIRWCYQEYKENMLTIFPRCSKVKNIGFDGSGTNSGSGKVFQAKIKEEKEWDFSYNEHDDRMFRKLRNYHSMLYIRQLLGKLWYKLTEYEYCLAYRFQNKENESFHVLKPDFRRWFADPIPFFYKGKYYVFMEVFDKLKKKGYIGLSGFDAEGRLKKPIKIIEEPFHMSFPNVFAYKGEIYMVPECSASEQIRIYQMQNGYIEKWNFYYAFDGLKNITDIAVCEGDNGNLYLLASEINSANPYQARLLLFSLTNLQDRSRIQIKLVWNQEEYTYSTRNGGNFIFRNREMLRVVQHSTKEFYGKFITLNRISELGVNGIKEEVVQKIASCCFQTPLPPFIFRVLGTHTFGQINMLEIADISVQRFSLGGLFMKIYRRL